MSDKPVTLIISDLHVGGGAADKGDDFVYDKNQLSDFIREQGRTPEGRNGDIELIVNGDFLEFAQVMPEVYSLGSSQYWCSEDESLQKLKAITDGHGDIFDAFKTFQSAGNLVTIGAGNHDVDLYWPRVQEELIRVSGPVQFETKNVWYSRHDNKLMISHGHMFDPANKFTRWDDPIMTDTEDGIARLEMCPGTLFMVKFVNWLEEKYPFADNLKPVTSLGRILWGENRMGLGIVGWMLVRFALRHPRASAGIKEMNADVGKKLVGMIQYDDEFAAEFTELYREVRGGTPTVEIVRLNLDNEDAVFDFLMEMMPRLGPERWGPVLEKVKPGGSLAIGGGRGTLAIKEGNKVDKEFLWERARQELLKDDGPQVVVMGHTHQPDERQADNGRLYFNPGSWTRYVDYEKNPNLTLDDLISEKEFPYELNFIRVERQSGGNLKAEKVTYSSEG